MSVIIAIIIYAIVRIFYTFALSPEYVLVDRIFSFTLLFGEMFLLVHALGYGIDLYKSTSVSVRDASDEHFFNIPSPPPEIAILVAARHEPKDVLERTFTALKNLRYPSKHIYFLDDSSEQKYKREAEELASKYDLILFRREERHGAKAGIVNDCLKTLKEKYVAIFDADQNPLPGFLLKLIAILEADPKLAFIQTPQFYTNMDASHVARGSAYQQAVFYEYICEAKGSRESMFCCGTNVVFRAKALKSVGGFDETVVTEDFATSIKLHMNGWKSLYYNHVGTFGMGPETLGAYFKQQSRWAKGTVGVFRKVILNFLKHPFKLSFTQWWEYFLSSTYYFVGLAFTFLMICPIAYLFFDVPSFFLRSDIYASVFLPYFSLSIAVFLFTLRSRNYKVRNLFTGQVLTYITFPVLIVSTIQGLFGLQGTFSVTEKGKGHRLSYWSLWPQLLFLFANYTAFVWGINRFYYERDIALLINCIWVLYHTFIMCGVLYFNQGTLKEQPK